MIKARKLILDESVTSTESVKTQTIKSMTNKAYRKRIDTVNRIIEKNNNQFADAQIRAAKMIIKSLNTDPTNSNIANVLKIANNEKYEGVNEKIFNAILEASMNAIQSDDTYYQVLILKDVEKSKSIKLYNVRFNIKKCVQLICESYPLFAEKTGDQNVLYMFSMFNLLKGLLDVLTVDLSINEAVIVAILNSYDGKASIEEIESRLKGSNLSDKYGKDFTTCKELHASLESLEKICVVTLKDDGKYELNECVLL